MPDFIFAYHGGTIPETQEEGEKAMAAWGKWFEDMGENVVNGGNPVGQSMTVTASGVTQDGGANPISGYTVVRADTPEAACEMARGCPMVADGSGSVEVAPIIEM
ncbi:YciI family protein [uncultured Tateyamaria sp.]|uniref:YciI family protein n=1 Tax=uncultured Tateyamaria sp. TaxID=455651 RepID=UPI0026270A1A|nr:YciI family protein [uncultured Tateyamaria sp.]